MNRRDFTITQHLRILAGLFLLLFPATVVSAASPKNIVLILADDLGWADTTLYGHTSLYETPNIERLAARGMTFSTSTNIAEASTNNDL